MVVPQGPLRSSFVRRLPLPRDARWPARAGRAGVGQSSREETAKRGEAVQLGRGAMGI